MFDIMVLRDVFLYVIGTCISFKVVTSDINSLLDWLTQNVNNSGMGYFVVICDLCKEVAREFQLPNNTEMSLIICICVLLFTTFLHV